MFETIVWATDGSELADGALELVKDLAAIHDSQVVAVHVNELVPGRYGSAPLRADESELRERIAGEVDELFALGVNASLDVRTGYSDVATQISEAADDLDADLIVVGTHGRGAIAGAVWGSVAKGLCHASHRPILVVPPTRAADRSSYETRRLTTA
ncbi:MAG TPA: universal stress protein [Gaiellaceae bacterium]|jgi:nucleotide-binding universal stress UspA family protein